MHVLLFSATFGLTGLMASPVQAASPEALNTFPQNTIDNSSVTLYYNGTGPVPGYNLTSPIPSPITPLDSAGLIQQHFFDEFAGIANGSSYSDNCTKCIASTELMHIAALTQPVSTVTNLLIELCNAIPAFQDTTYAISCYEEFSGIGGLGPYWAQLFSKMSIATGDMQAWCWHYDVCERPPTIEIDESLYFSPKPESANAVPEPSGQTINVLHLSDWHLDPRYDIGSEANCSQSLCCRPYSTNRDLHTTSQNATVPASRFGSFLCDSPADLALSSFTSMPMFFNMSAVSFSIFTGDIVSHDNNDQLSRAYVEYEETVTYQTFKKLLNNIPVYATLGNHDTLPEALNTQNSVSAGSKNAMSWNYELLSSMWQKDGWINGTEAAYAAVHYGAYAHTTSEGLRIISLNTDFWYAGNAFNYWNFSNPDTSGMLTWLAQELTVCEARGQRAWIIGHVLSGYEGRDTLPNPSALFYSIVRRFSPATIAGIFFGHTHQDQLQIFYDYLPDSIVTRNGRQFRDTVKVDYSKPLQMAFIGPSITPMMGLNSGYQLYQVDAATFSVTDMQTYVANVSESLVWTAPEWRFEYDARTAYDDMNAASWPRRAPLNASFWHAVTHRMLRNHSLVEMYSLFETKSSVLTPDCSSADCAQQKVCYIRSGSAALGYACPGG